MAYSEAADLVFENHVDQGVRKLKEGSLPDVQIRRDSSNPGRGGRVLPDICDDTVEVGEETVSQAWLLFFIPDRRLIQLPSCLAGRLERLHPPAKRRLMSARTSSQGRPGSPASAARPRRSISASHVPSEGSTGSVGAPKLSRRSRTSAPRASSGSWRASSKTFLADRAMMTA